MVVLKVAPMGTMARVGWRVDADNGAGPTQGRAQR
jgi:hypothetical protein